MARLLRMHFASIGHEDARLAPLTLDFRHAGDGPMHGRAADTVLWLRNGGGKSSILNLFYSVFRPAAREFLGSSAEGKARKLHDYVQAGDLAFVVTEWDVEPPDGLELFGSQPSHVRIAGQVLAWKNRRRSADLHNLRRLFFSLSAQPGGLSFDTLPIHGLGEPVESFDAFREWLKDSSHGHSAQEIVYTENHAPWLSHLEKVGLDTELFRYQLLMNRREGAADEAFRFRRDVDFIRFLLQLAFEPETAQRIARNLESQRENLLARPTWELEQRFVGEALDDVRGLAAAARALRAADEDLTRTTHEVAAAAGGLDARSEDLTAAAEQTRARAAEVRERARLASNARDMKQRWVRGLERLALSHDEAEARARAADAEEYLDELGAELAAAHAAKLLGDVRTLEAEVLALREALALEQAELEPLRRAACERGSALRSLLDKERARLDAAAQDLRRFVADAERAERDALNEHVRARESIAEAGAEVRAIDEQLDRRERAREQLLREELVLRREPAGDALARWQTHVGERELSLDANAGDRQRLERELGVVGDRREEVVAERASLAGRADSLAKRLDAALGWRDRLRAEAPIREVEEVDEPDLEAPGLVDRLLRRARAAQTRTLTSRVDGAEDSRSLDWLRDHGLLPSPIDVRRVIDALSARGLSAHAGPEYLEQNLPATRAAELLERDPALFAGVIVTTDEALAQARGLVVDGLRCPVQVSRVESLELDLPEHANAHVLLPDPAQYDRTAAAERRSGLEASVSRRLEREARFDAEETAARRLADEVQRYLNELGGGELALLERHAEETRHQVEIAENELLELGRRNERLRGELATATAEAERLRKERERGHRATEALRRFIDEHDERAQGARLRKQALNVAIRAAEEEASRAELRAQQQRSLALRFTKQQLEEENAAREVTAERDAVVHCDREPCSAPLRSLGEARVAYDTARRKYEGELTDKRAQWELDRCEDDLAEARSLFDQKARDLDRASIDRFVGQGDLQEELRRLAEAEGQQQRVSAQRHAAHQQSVSALRTALARRREPDDLPPDRPRPPDAASARSLGVELAVEAEEHARQTLKETAAAEELEGCASEDERTAERCGGLADGLRSNAKVAGIELPPIPGRPVTDDFALIDSATAKLRDRFADAYERRQDTERRAHRCAQEVQRMANRSEYTELAAQYKERMKDSAESLFDEADDLSERLVARLAVVNDALTRLDEDRRLIVEQLLHLADGVAKLLRRAQTASTLPASLEGWGGRPYLRISFSFPSTDDERRARLEPLVTRLVAQAQLPDGLELVVQTAIELAGPKGFEVKILKPDTVLRPEPIPLHLMNTFSRGQQLTAAILLYCTLVQLRARTRGRGRISEDAGVLILDNPIGTCSNVTLLRLQRTIAERMRVQLIYTTGVDDLEALAILPNKIRLRNTHRDRATGHYHVTEDVTEERGSVESVRLVEVPAR